MNTINNIPAINSESTKSTLITAMFLLINDAQKTCNDIQDVELLSTQLNNLLSLYHAV